MNKENSEQDSLFNEVYEEAQKPREEQVLSVGTYLRLLNIGLKRSGSRRIKGEVSSVNMKDRYLFFNIKDKEEKGMLKCFMWKNDYDLSGVDVEIGMEVIVFGYPKVFERTGDFNLQTQTIELVGEGTLKKAYDKLKEKLEKEGLFLPERKKAIPDFPRKIGLITSRDAAAFGDFLNNLDRFNFKVIFLNSSVEGKRAVPELLKAVRLFRKKDIDLLVITRGGGSIESLQAFDNEALVREVSNFPKPVIAAIGHHKDIPLVALSADLSVSTPTAAAKEINRSWESARYKVYEYEREILDIYGRNLFGTERRIFSISGNLRKSFKGVIEDFHRLESEFFSSVGSLKNMIDNAGERIKKAAESIAFRFGDLLRRARERIESAKETISAFNPRRQLELGYSIVFAKGSIIRSIGDVKEKQEIDIQVSDGIIEGEVKGKRK